MIRQEEKTGLKWTEWIEKSRRKTRGDGEMLGKTTRSVQKRKQSKQRVKKKRKRMKKDWKTIKEE